MIIPLFCNAINLIDYITQLSRSSCNVNNINNNKLKNRHEIISENDGNDNFLSNIDKDNIDALHKLYYLLNSNDGWYNIGTKKGVKVERRYLIPSGSFISNVDVSKGSKHACIKSTAILDISPDHVFNLLADSKRAREYNDHININRDVIYLPRLSNSTNWTKCTWAATGKIGIFKARDFLTVAHFTRYDNGTSIMLNRPAYLNSYPATDKYVRATVLLAGNIIQPYGLHGNQTHLTMLAQINPGGISDTPAAAWIINKLCASGPPTFIRKLEHAAQKTKTSISTSKKNRALVVEVLSLTNTFNNKFQSTLQRNNLQLQKFFLSSMERLNMYK